jgi:hypothetical protein
MITRSSVNAFGWSWADVTVVVDREELGIDRIADYRDLVPRGRGGAAAERFATRQP